MNSATARYGGTILAFVAAASIAAQDISVESMERLERQETTGLRYYERGNYQKAFDNLSATAVRGLKQSQYMLAFMFLKGQHVDQSIVLGMAWLGVAIESGEPEWIELYDSLYQRATPEQKVLIAAKVAQYIEQYGMSAQNVSCSRRPVAGSRRAESRCLKQAEKPYPLFPVELKPE
jgi:TPR repeat protein